VEAGPRGAARRRWRWAAGKQSAHRVPKRVSSSGVDVLARLVVRWGRRFSRVTSFVASFDGLRIAGCPRVQGGAEGSEEDQNLAVTGGDG